MGILLNLAIAVAILYFLWRLTKPKWDLHVIVDASSVRFVDSVSVATAKRAAIENFLRNDISATGRIVVRVRREESGRMTTQIKGDVDQGMRQRIRNFLVSQL